MINKVHAPIVIPETIDSIQLRNEMQNSDLMQKPRSKTNTN